MRKEKYTCLTNAEREEISRCLANKKPLVEIARHLGRNPSTISREIKRNSGKTGYRAFRANNRAQAAASSRRKGKSKITKRERLCEYVLGSLNKEWSPEEISERIKIEYPLDMTMRISHEAIYRYIYVLPRGELKQTLIKALRQEHKYRRKQKTGKTEENRGKIANMLSIEERPAEVANRFVPGHWEEDLIFGQVQKECVRNAGRAHNPIYHFGSIRR